MSDKILKEVAEKYPQTMEEMQNLINCNLKVFAAKQLDYGPNNIAMNGNDHLALLGIAIRGNDKIQRILNLLTEGQQPKNESLEDSFLDLANYCLMACIVNRGKWGK
jgi:hypothetical protein|tara:strand:- start:3744 stop:4064 length:321 start_codon:yes stop_codon:yes gene_type:complete